MSCANVTVFKLKTAFTKDTNRASLDTQYMFGYTPGVQGIMTRAVLRSSGALGKTKTWGPYDRT
jgi:hypothetical protein